MKILIKVSEKLELFLLNEGASTTSYTSSPPEWSSNKGGV